MSSNLVMHFITEWYNLLLHHNISEISARVTRHGVWHIPSIILCCILI